jgi:hypothetical protein
MTKKLNSLFDIVTFGQRCRKLPLPYDPEVTHPKGIDSRPDIERILDGLANASPVLRMPEENPISWKAGCSAWPESKLQLFNSYRRRFGLPDA